MIKRIFALGAAIACISMAGCATNPISPSQASPGIAFAYVVAGAGTVPVIITRDIGMMSSACATDIMVDGRPAGSVGVGESITLHIPAGEVIIGARPSSICAGGLVEREVNLVQNRPINLRVSYDHNGGLGLYRSAVR